MNIIEKATIRHYHRHRIQSYQDGTIESLGWRESDSQEKRFEVLASVADLNNQIIMDIGCGYGDLKPFLDRSYSGFIYLGIDQMPEFINIAKSRYANHANCHFYLTDFTTASLPQVDYVMASGALGYRCENPQFYFDMIQKMYEAAGKVLAFNMLDANKFPNHPLLLGHDPDTIVSYCETLSPHVSVTSGYLRDDFSVFIHKHKES